MVNFIITWFSHLWKSFELLLTARHVAPLGVSGEWFPFILVTFFLVVGQHGLLIQSHCWLIDLAPRVTTGPFQTVAFKPRCLEIFCSKCKFFALAEPPEVYIVGVFWLFLFVWLGFFGGVFCHFLPSLSL